LDFVDPKTTFTYWVSFQYSVGNTKYEKCQ
jgi:hypothetical protein